MSDLLENGRRPVEVGMKGDEAELARMGESVRYSLPRRLQCIEPIDFRV